MSEAERRKYTEEFKTEAVRLVREAGKPVAQVARELGISTNLLYRWRGESASGAPDLKIVPPPAWREASQLFCDQVLEHLVLQGQLRKHALELGVFGFQFLGAP